MLVEFEGTNGTQAAFDAYEIVAVFAATDKKGGLPILGVALLQLRGAANGLPVKGDVSGIIARVNAARRQQPLAGGQ